MNDLSQALRRRLPSYFRVLIKLYGKGKEIVSSDELASELGLVPSQIRQDMKAIGCQGQRSYGYGIPALYKRIADVLQLSDKFRAVMIGSTNLARAIAENQIFSKRGIKLCSVFSDDKSGWTLLPDCPVSDENSFPAYFEALTPDIVILAGSPESASKHFSYLEYTARNSDRVFEVWNFTDEDLYSDKVKTKNIHMTDYLMLLCLDAGADTPKVSD